MNTLTLKQMILDTEKNIRIALSENNVVVASELMLVRNLLKDDLIKALELALVEQAEVKKAA